MTLDQTAARWWDEHGSTLKGGDRLIERAIYAIGPKTRIADITIYVVAEGIQRRQGIVFIKSAAKGAKGYLPKAGTVNRDMIDSLRPILIRARNVSGAKLPEID